MADKKVPRSVKELIIKYSKARVVVATPVTKIMTLAGRRYINDTDVIKSMLRKYA